MSAKPDAFDLSRGVSVLDGAQPSVFWLDAVTAVRLPYLPKRYRFGLSRRQWRALRRGRRLRLFAQPIRHRPARRLSAGGARLVLPIEL
jgi:hypothetical protein